mmetsp:Transcript_3410/g.11762  ORF Transcript_3410/g.11762 Transcript_3410/m.11762 type:complete len:319 (-) Transcript_3410:2526-3482(-)
MDGTDLVPLTEDAPGELFNIDRFASDAIRSSLARRWFLCDATASNRAARDAQVASAQTVLPPPAAPTTKSVASDPPRVASAIGAAVSIAARPNAEALHVSSSAPSLLPSSTPSKNTLSKPCVLRKITPPRFRWISKASQRAGFSHSTWNTARAEDCESRPAAKGRTLAYVVGVVFTEPRVKPSSCLLWRATYASCFNADAVKNEGSPVLKTPPSFSDKLFGVSKRGVFGVFEDDETRRGAAVVPPVGVAVGTRRVAFGVAVRAVSFVSLFFEENTFVRRVTIQEAAAPKRNARSKRLPPDADAGGEEKCSTSPAAEFV